MILWVVLAIDDQASEIYEKANDIMNAGGFVLRKWHSNSNVLQAKFVAVSERIHEEMASTSEESLGSTQEFGDKDELIPSENQPIVSEQFESDDKTNKPCSVKVLGLNWNCKTDEIKYDLSELVSYAATLSPTKRSVLRLTAKIFDHLGLLAPFTITMKVWFQALCVQGVNWDDMLDGESLAMWKRLIQDFSALHDVRVPRCYFRVTKKPVSHQLHGYS